MENKIPEIISQSDGLGLSTPLAYSLEDMDEISSKASVLKTKKSSRTRFGKNLMTSLLFRAQFPSDVCLNLFHEKVVTNDYR